MNTSSHLSIYTLSYNAPKQLELWSDTFQKAYPNTFNTCTKYLINNTDNDDLLEAYDCLIRKYGFIEINRGVNMGINTGRHLIAQHFEASEYEYMIFFEDDMLMFEDNHSVCKCGFLTYHVNLFQTALEIMQLEDLDYLKLSYSEVEGDNNVNWAWYTIKDEFKDGFFPTLPDGSSDRRTFVENIGTHQGISYAVGDYFYCNWPLVFSKKGNKKVFLEEEFEIKYEPQWMFLSFKLHRSDRLKAACLLMSPINHNRVYDYDRTQRKENEYK